MTEAGSILLKQAKADGIPYVTATHDRKNFRSGAVMKRLGMTYRYSYEEQWATEKFPRNFSHVSAQPEREKRRNV